MIWLTLSFVSVVTCAGQSRLHKEKRLRKGGVGPEMRSPAGLGDNAKGFIGTVSIFCPARSSS